MRVHRSTILLPIIAAGVTWGLWVSARMQYFQFVCPPAGACPANGWPLGWTDYAPPSIQAAGMLNVPIAFFGQPLYRLVHEDVSRRELVAMLLGSIVMWGYIGWRLDTRNCVQRPNTAVRVAAALGTVFALLILIQTIVMFHVGLLYKATAVCWSLMMVRHCVLLLRSAPNQFDMDDSSNRLRLLPVTLSRLTCSWAVFLVLGALALSPRGSFGAPDPTRAHVVAIIGALLLLLSAYAVIAHLVIEWRAVARRSRAAWAGFDTGLTFAGVAAILIVIVRG